MDHSATVVDRRAWWSAQRKSYNKALIIAAPASLLATFIVWALFEDRLPCLEINGLMIFASIPLFAIGLALANVCYLLGPLAERIVRPRNVTFFRSSLYRIGLGFSLLLVFEPAIVNLIAALLGPLPCTDKLGQRHGAGTSLPGMSRACTAREYRKAV